MFYTNLQVKDMLDYKREKLFFAGAFIVIASIVLFIINIESDERLKENLDNTTRDITHDYKVFFNNYKTLSHLIFDTKINKPEILKLFKERKRDELFNLLSSDYKLIKNYNISQLHFHTNENISFLRMHRPLKFGDDLSNIRPTVRYVNKTNKFISGFEEGRIFNGFRFVYPLSYENQHIGSVEISFSGLFFIEEVLKNYNLRANLFINKEVVLKKVFNSEHSNYIDSSLNGYYFQKSIVERLKKEFPEYKQDLFSKKQQKFIQSKILKGKPFSLYQDDTKNSITFIPLINPITKDIVAALKIDSHDKFIESQLANMFVIKIVLVILIAIIIFTLYRIYFFQRDLKSQIKVKTKELEELNKNLKDIIAKEIIKNKEKDELMIAQSRHAAMGEMISMIAHQWRQPIAVISMAVNNILIDIELGMVDEEQLTEIANDILEQTNHLSKTIDDFKDFFKPGKKKELIKVNDVIEESMKIIGKSLENNNIELIKEFDSSISIDTFSRELLQVILNLLKNAKEALIDNQIAKKKIIVRTFDENGFITIEICDNGKGIDETIKDNIFQPYFSTKEEKMGTGLGLYMSKTIIEKHIKGILDFYNKDDGVCFFIKIPY